MIWFILYLLLIIPVWFVAMKVYLSRGLSREDGDTGYWVNKHGRRITDTPPGMFGFIWPIMAPFIAIYYIGLTIKIGLIKLDASILKAAKSVEIKVEKK